MNNIIIDRKSISEEESKNLYLRCSCGEEIIGFHYYKWFDGDEGYYIHFYGNRDKKINDKFSDFYFESSTKVEEMVNNLLNFINKEIKIPQYTLKLEDRNSIPENYLKRNGPSILEINIDRIASGIIDISKFKNNKLAALNKPKCTWGIVVDLDRFKMFLEGIKEILNA